MTEKHHGTFTEETGSGWVLRGNKFYHDARYDDALKCYQEAQRKEHNKTAVWNIHNRLCATYTRLQDYQNALNEANSMIKEDPTHPKGHIRKGGALFFLGRFDEALAEYESARGLMAAAHSLGVMSSTQVENLQSYIAATKAKLSK